ncbi:hypothetical protein [Marinobacter sp. X15-166B]|uniref:hypothetical protein n=1 Tax=Marinobacter sp. X15-166B TaxID=1897620 RepID=UPI001D173F0F|nr:hypothetical protein [Marinobacter sp. X15-166B]
MQFLIVMVVAAIFVGWIGWRGFEVISLNQKLRDNETIANYPYQHRVLRVEGRTAVMSALHSYQRSAREALATLHPELRLASDGDRSWQRAERDLAHVQALAGSIILSSPGISRIRWELDSNWYHLTAMQHQRAGSH